MEKSSRFARLLKRLKSATSERGKKSELARHLKVPPARVLEWLSGVHEPGAETTLRLLEWVAAEEGKTKTVGSATNTTNGHRTRSRHPCEKPKPSPKKK